MKTVRIIKNWDFPDLFRQTPEGKGIWKNTYFTEEKIHKCDYAVVLNFTTKPIRIKCPQNHLWCIHQEPPNEYFGVRQLFTNTIYAKVFTPNLNLTDSRYIHSHGAIAWHIGKSYDEMKKNSTPLKNRILSCIISNKTNFSGHRQRLKFLTTLTGKMDFDLFGYGFKPVKNKWDALAHYRYSLIFENYSGPDYWSEKLADCFLSGTMPIYYGCTNLTKYFPKESFVSIDLNNPNAISIIKKTINSNLWIRNKKAIEYARDLILDKYQIFPFLTNYINKSEKESIRKRVTEWINIPNEDNTFNKIRHSIYRLSHIKLHI
ncbi:MAG: glycosyltransferase family 10 [Bacteroidota bacterium]